MKDEEMINCKVNEFIRFDLKTGKVTKVSEVEVIKDK